MPSSPSSETGSLAAQRHPLVEWAIITAIFTLTFVVRWPFLAESFWVDELHTAWCVADGWSDVAPRAKMGNQQPLYFWLLWIWQQIPWAEPFASYPVEVLPRSTSLWCVSLSAALITWGSMRYHGSLLAAAVAGLAFAVDRQAAFYGVELRPYAAVILCSTLAVGCAARLWSSPNRPQPLGWAGLHLSVLLATWMHITSLLTLAPLIVAISACDLIRSRSASAEFKRGIWRHLWWLALWILVGCLLANHQREIWNHRAAWSAFGRPQSIFAIWKMWPWLGWTFIPGIVAAVSMLGSSVASVSKSNRGSGAVHHPAPNPHHRTISFTLLCVTVLLLSVLSAYFLAKFLGVPIWHRRYLVAGLPLGCISLGGWIASIRPQKHYEILATTVAILSLAAIPWAQGSIHPQVASYWVYRQENWRDAIRQIARETEPTSQMGSAPLEHHLWIDGDLIEQPATMGEVTDRELAAYLTLPARGSYSPGKHVQLHAIGSLKPMEGWQRAAHSSPTAAPPSKHWFLSRFLPQSQQTVPPLSEQGRQHYGKFGNLSLYSIMPREE
ncbi:hypothetical protein [Rhodopirellula sp. P2]|uniref:hypothetical protein n=1 Tax=Rhodopirellula sp. P2 TaxID=2127060 RepID=UPI00236751B2|nr:hypothetical protein [Rhodopirellula sp. P2]WDQ15935.1 hypothetical protein PSR62_20190 [Rhodopirellula sp. P2]